VPAGCVLAIAAKDEKFARECAAKGFRLICFGTDAGLLQSAMK
jgi:2-keto-3-deoxy-L-rhamnonate aldolase RhmA